MDRVSASQLRAAFAQRMAKAYGAEVPAYNTLVDVAAQVNAEVIARDGVAAERLGAISRVTAERHGAIRVGTATELRQLSRVFGALGMHPVGFYDLRDAARSAVPVVSTAFRPTDAIELARNPFRMFTSVLVTDDRRFFTADLQARLDEFLSRRRIFGDELIALSEAAIAAGGLGSEDATRFLGLATASFALSGEPIERAWYSELEQVSAVAADIGGVRSTHINHLTPRVLDIDALYERMLARGVAMIGDIQGPPRWAGPAVLLRQTSFRALAEPRRFRAADGSVSTGELRVRFGEVESRGIALTPAGRDRYDAMMIELDRRLAGRADSERPGIVADVCSAYLPATEDQLLRDGLGFFTVEIVHPDRARAGGNLWTLIDQGALLATPIVYEDFLPRSAAGIFQSNLSGDGSKDSEHSGSRRDVHWLAGVLDQHVSDPVELYASQQNASLDAALGRALALAAPSAVGPSAT